MSTTKYQPGQSGNPKGRPKEKTSASFIRKTIADDLPDIVKSLIAKAKKGDVQAAKILLDRVCPPLKPQTMPISLPVDGGLVEQGNEVIKATLTGDIPPDIGAALITALSHQAKLVEIDDLTKRIEALENQT